MPKNKTVEEIVEEINALGFRIHDIFQFDDFWQCNLRASGYIYYDFVQAYSLREALEKAHTFAHKLVAKNKIPEATGLVLPSEKEEDFSDI